MLFFHNSESQRIQQVMQGAICWELIVEYRFSLSLFSFFLGLNDVFPSLKRILLYSHVSLKMSVNNMAALFIYLVVNNLTLHKISSQLL